MDSPPLSPGLQDVMDTDAASRASSPQPGASRRRLRFPEGHGKTLAQVYEPYLTVNPRSAACDMLVKEGFLGLTMTPADPDAQQQMVIVHGDSTAINVDHLSTPEAFLWLKRNVNPTLSSWASLKGPCPARCLGRFHMGLYIPEPDLCGHCCRFGHQSWKCKSAPRCSYCSGSILPSSAWRRYVLAPESSCCVATVGATTMPLCAAALLGPGRSGSHRPPGTTVGPSRVVFRPTPAPQHNA
ncbi:hypothetical protein E2C01_092672 [Portunus trituberculatus]|uniref:Uncharacterized protein n=1 Tax=Portunus trituberculatus TaxID=210409 RepID=A0A5B7JKW1_PORTR|nr:hypothetical protein [Portunus trituberculatus]